jgi:aconitate hydratase
VEYATKRYRSNLINWGIVPFTWDGEFTWADGAVLRVPGIRKAIQAGQESVTGYIDDTALTLHMGQLSDKEREILLSGCLMNWYNTYGKK